MFLASDFVHGPAHVLHDVIQIEHDLPLGIRDLRQGGLHVRLVHIHCNGNDCLELFVGQGFQVGLEAAPVSAVADMFHRAEIEVANESEVSLPPGDGLLVNAEMPDQPRFLALKTTLNRTVEDVPRFVPADAQNLPGRLDVSYPHHINGQAFEKQREPGLGLCPRQ